MCEAGRIRHHLKHNLWRPECTILFVGYQAVGTLGRTLIEGATDVKLFGEPIEVRAEICQLTGLSGHADKNGLLAWINAFAPKPKRVFIVHGDDKARAVLPVCSSGWSAPASACCGSSSTTRAGPTRTLPSLPTRSTPSATSGTDKKNSKSHAKAWLLSYVEGR